MDNKGINLTKLLDEINKNSEEKYKIQKIQSTVYECENMSCGEDIVYFITSENIDILEVTSDLYSDNIHIIYENFITKDIKCEELSSVDLYKKQDISPLLNRIYTNRHSKDLLYKDKELLNWVVLKDINIKNVEEYIESFIFVNICLERKEWETVLSQISDINIKNKLLENLKQKGF